MYSKRGQLTLFVIIAILIVGVVLAVFFLVPKTTSPQTTSESFNPITYIQSCYDDDIEQYIEPISLQGGYLEPSPFFTIEEGSQIIKAQYLLSQGITLKPVIEQDIESQLEDKMTPIARNCIKSYKSGLISKGNEVTTCNLNSMPLDIKLEPGTISSYINCPINITTKDNRKLTFDSFTIYHSSQLYSIVTLARDILYAEYRNNYQEILELIVNYQLSHPEILIYREERTQTPHDVIYRIIYGENKFYFAIRK